MAVTRPALPPTADSRALHKAPPLQLLWLARRHAQVDAPHRRAEFAANTAVFDLARGFSKVRRARESDRTTVWAKEPDACTLSMMTADRRGSTHFSKFLICGAWMAAFAAPPCAHQ